MREFEAVELKRYLEQSEHPPLLLDVRQPWEYDICRLEQARLLPMGDLPAKMDELDKEQEIVVICHHGIRSRQVGRFLEASGFKNIINLSTGMAGWAAQVDRTMATY
jgi:rhodanese-related sulfurtransferase